MCDSDAQVSFFSGHASTAFALAVATARNASLLKYKNAGAIKATSLGLATATSLLRIGADRHYLTDVVVGAAVGTGVALAVTEINRPGSVTATNARPPGKGDVLSLALPLKGAMLSAGVGRGMHLQLAGRW
jgi:membrane-associated phospholipid phosphatase